jgi:hypothetical protein
VFLFQQTKNDLRTKFKSFIFVFWVNGWKNSNSPMKLYTAWNNYSPQARGLSWIKTSTSSRFSNVSILCSADKTSCRLYVTNMQNGYVWRSLLKIYILDTKTKFSASCHSLLQSDFYKVLVVLKLYILLKDFHSLNEIVVWILFTFSCLLYNKTLNVCFLGTCIDHLQLTLKCAWDIEDN